MSFLDEAGSLIPSFNQRNHSMNWRPLISIFTVVIALYLLGAWWQYQSAEREYAAQATVIARQKAQENAALAAELNAYSTPIIQAIYRYKAAQGEYPPDLSALVPGYLPAEPYAAFGEKLRYDRAEFYGIPFYFGFFGHYPGLAALHGWRYIYCPAPGCSVAGEGIYRIDPNWIFMHGSAF